MSKSFQVLFIMASCALGVASLVALSLADNGGAMQKGKSGIMPTANLASIPEPKIKRKCWPRQPCGPRVAPIGKSPIGH